MRLDLHDRRTLAKSWLATLHGSQLTFRPRLVGPLPGWGPLIRTALAWHVAYALTAYAGAVAVARTGSGAVAQAASRGGTGAVILLALALWLGAVTLSSALWWLEVRRARPARRARSASAGSLSCRR